MVYTFLLLPRGAIFLRTGQPAVKQPPVPPQLLAQGASAEALLSGQVHAALKGVLCWLPMGTRHQGL